MAVDVNSNAIADGVMVGMKKRIDSSAAPPLLARAVEIGVSYWCDQWKTKPLDSTF